jgi:oligoendopeptidase F
LTLNTIAQIHNFGDYIESSANDDEINVDFITSLYDKMSKFKPIYQKYRNVADRLLKKHLNLSTLEP